MSQGVIVIGAGANGLVAAHLLAKAGRNVLVLEQREQQPAGLERGAVLSEVAGELGLTGLTVERPDPWISAALDGGGRLELYQDVTRSAESIRRVSAKDADQWPAFCRRMHQLAGVLESLSAAPALDIETTHLGELFGLARLGLKVRGLGKAAMVDLLRILPMPVSDLLDEWFENAQLKALIAAGGVMHLCQGPRSGATTFVMLHHAIGAGEGVFRQPRTNLRALLLGKPGVTVRHGARVERILAHQGQVTGVRLAGGEELAAGTVISGADPRATMLGLLEPGRLAPEFSLAVRNIRARGVAAQVTLELDGPAPFTSVFEGASIEQLERAYDDVKYGRISAKPWFEAHAGGNRVDAHVQYVPSNPEGGFNEGMRIALAATVVAGLERHAPGIKSRIRSTTVTAPSDLASRGLTEGQAYHAELGLDQILFMRPVAGWSRYRMPIRGLYLCGAGTHPGGALAGASGRLAARAILEDRS